MSSWIPETEIRFAAKSGFLTHGLWLKHFAGDHHRSWNFRRWTRMLKEGHFLDHHSTISPGVVVPNPNSPVVQRICPGRLARAPFVAELRHDEILFDGLLSLVQAGLVQEFETEDELSCSEVDGVLRSRGSLKLPDLSIVTTGGRVLAIEVELTQKSQRRYREVLSAYRARREVDAILYAIPSRGLMRPILRAAETAGFPLNKMPIGFMSIEGWQLNPVDRQMSFGHEVTTLKQFMQQKRKQTGT